MFDDGYDRAALLVELMSHDALIRPWRWGWRSGWGGFRLTKGEPASSGPFAVPDESLGLLEDPAAQGVSSPHFDFLLRGLGLAIVRRLPGFATPQSAKGFQCEKAAWSREGNMRRKLLIPLLSAGLALPAVADATPEDPYGDDYVALSVNPQTGRMFFGTSGTSDGAANIAMAQCNSLGGPCVIAGGIQYGCVAVAWNPDGSWAGGQGNARDVASAIALSKLGGLGPGGRVGGHCSA